MGRIFKRRVLRDPKCGRRKAQGVSGMLFRCDVAHAVTHNRHPPLPVGCLPGFLDALFTFPVKELCG
jgi:hypothetical protein